MNNQATKKYVHNADAEKEYKKVGFWKRLQLRVLSPQFLIQVIYKIFRFVLLIGISYHHLSVPDENFRFLLQPGRLCRFDGKAYPASSDARYLQSHYH